MKIDGDRTKKNQTASAAAEQKGRKRLEIRHTLSKYSQQLFLGAVIILLGIVLSIQSEYFLTIGNFINIADACGYRLIVAVGMTVIMASGVMDLSAGSIVSLAGVITAYLLHAGAGIPAAGAAGLMIGIVAGIANGLLIHYTKISFFIITLAMSGMLRGLSLIITDGRPITRFGAEFMFIGTGRLGGIQLSVYLAALTAIAAAIAMSKSRWGSSIKTIGSNEEALRKCGVNTVKYRVSVQAVMGLAAAVTAVIITARLNSAEPNAGLNMELDAITAAAMGGTPITGGKACIGGTVLAIIILGMIRNGLTLMSVPSDYQQWITGFLLLVSVLVSGIRIKNNKTTADKKRRTK